MFKEVYYFFARGNEYESIFEDDRRSNVHASSWDSRIIELKYFEGDLLSYYDELKRFSRFFLVLFDPVFGATSCSWKKIPEMIVTFDEYHSRFIKELDSGTSYLIPNLEDLLRQGDCGSELGVQF